jgi:hypothetical protein
MILLMFRKDLENTANKGSLLRFRVNDVDIRGTDYVSAEYDTRIFEELKSWHSIIDFALWGLATIKALGVAGIAWLEDSAESGNDLLFRMVGDDIVVVNMLTDATVQVSYRDLLVAWVSFAHEIHDYVVHKFPEAASLPVWTWLTEMPSPDQIKMIYDSALYVAQASGYEL